ncbi:MAG: sulfatase-like hydrolase/transferase [Pirellulaceae bacterium]
MPHTLLHSVPLRILLLLLTVVLARCAAAAESESRPNVVLCMADDQGWGDVAYYGHPVLKTPVLDEMAASALRFDRFYAAAPVCSPTRGSVLTGRHPNRFGCFKWGHPLRPQETTIAEALRTAGYTTGHFGKWHLGSTRADSPVSPTGSGFDEWFSSPNFYENSPLLSHNGEVVETRGESSEVTVDLALKFMADAVKRDKPFLAVVWFGNPHSPHVAVDELKALYPDVPSNLQNYYGEITGIDRAMGKLRQGLRKLNVADNTLLWYTSDNGAQGPGSTGGLRGKKGSLWEGGIRVPNIIEWPAKIKKPAVTNFAGNTVDIYPTLMDVAGVEVENQVLPLDGVSLLPVIEGAAERRTAGMGFWDYPASGRPMKSGQMLAAQRQQQAEGELPEEEPVWKITKQYSDETFPGHSAWMSGDLKLHRIAGKNGENVKYELYNLAEDRAETIDLAADQPQRVAELKAELEAWLKSVVGSLNGNDYDN